MSAGTSPMEGVRQVMLKAARECDQSVCIELPVEDWRLGFVKGEAFMGEFVKVHEMKTRFMGGD
eukprot:8085069-Heterocapsa_arctica.AAC.1